jgi:hypothetical protein
VATGHATTVSGLGCRACGRLIANLQIESKSYPFLDFPDDAVFQDEPIRFLVGAEYEARAVEMCTEIEQMRTSGELANIIGRMHLE